MFFLLSKILGFFALPSNLAATTVAIGVALLFTRYRVAGRRLAALGTVMLLVAGLSTAQAAPNVPPSRSWRELASTRCTAHGRSSVRSRKRLFSHWQCVCCKASSPTATRFSSTSGRAAA